MNSYAEHEEPEDKILEFPIDPIKQLYVQIRKMPELTKQARVIDQVLAGRLQELKGTASTVIKQFSDQESIILQKFDNWIMPIAKEVLDGFIHDAMKLKNRLEDKLDHIDETTAEEWNDQAKHWAQLNEQWNDRKGLADKILEVVASRTKHLIDKDVQVIHEYQSQSIAHLPKESEAFKNVEERLNHAIADPLKQLMSLRKPPQSIQQASEWVAKLQEKRESYFDQLLMKIDHIIKEVVHVEERVDWSAFLEIEGEIIFMERELHHINIDLSKIHLAEESDRQFLAARIEGLSDHVEELDTSHFPSALKHRVTALKEGIAAALERLQ